MSEEDFEYWLHASDEERAALHASWNLDKDEGKNIAAGVAKLLKEECVYDVLDVIPVKVNGQWKIQGIAGADYDSLKDRKLEFLGFKLTFIQAE